MAENDGVLNQLNECAEKRDFEGAFKIVRANQERVTKELRAPGVKDILKKATADRLILSFIDGVGIGERPISEALMRLEKLLAFKPGTLVLSKAWGLGKVVRLDYFYRRITVDFATNRGHQFSYSAATETLQMAPEGHVLVLREADPAAFETMLKEKPGDFIVKVLMSYGDITIVRLEDICVQNGFVKGVNWKKFWEKARADLRKNALVEIPARRADPIRLKRSQDESGSNWLTEFSHETDPKLILATVREVVAGKKLEDLENEVKEKLAERLAFAVTAARKVDDALYARLACTVTACGFANPSAAEMRSYLWERKRFVKAAAALPAREVGALVSFLAVDDEAKARLYRALPLFCFAAVSEVVMQFKDEAACRQAVAEFMKQPQAPATLVTLIVGKYEQFREWTELPPLITELSHAIALGEGRQGGETLKMQNIVRRLFGDKNWLKKMFDWLSPEERALFFERFQASIAWDPSTHHATVVRMSNLAPELKAHLVVIEKKREYARVTSFRSFGLRKMEYLKLINEDMPENVRKIEFAKGFGDLSENAEYQYAKDEQRTLMQKQTLMQEELETVKPGEFLDATTDEVMPGVTVIATTKDGERTWTVLGEWDNDVERGILSSKTRVAQNMLGKKVGDTFELPDAEGGSSLATVKEILPLSDEIREWMKLPAGVQI